MLQLSVNKAYLHKTKMPGASGTDPISENIMSRPAHFDEKPTKNVDLS
jgi:hypothetical protein